jgi:hypothetical protein
MISFFDSFCLSSDVLAAGISLSESGDTGCIKGQGILDLAKDLGQVDDADPILLILAWKLRCESTWEITHSEFVDGFGGQYGYANNATYSNC